MSRLDRFTQPARGIHVVYRATRFGDAAIAAVRARVEAGEDPAAVAADMAAESIANEGELRTASRDDSPIHRAADARLRQMTLVVNAAFMRGRKAYKDGGVDAAAEAIRASLFATLPSVLLKAYASGGDAGLASLKKARAAESLRTLKPGERASFKTSFGASNPRAAKWARERATELAEGISETSRERIRDAVARAHEEGDLDESYDEILDAIGDEARASVIARTETMTAANEGQREAWDQAVESGLLDGDSRVAWIATSGCCDECDALDGEERALDGEYPDPGEDGPPLHPNCRCTEGIVG